MLSVFLLLFQIEKTLKIEVLQLSYERLFITKPDEGLSELKTLFCFV